MNFTAEQEAIFASTGNIKINAVAGSGKTTSLVEYARRQGCGTSILYLAFNRSVKMEAAKKFADRGMTNVDVQTAHSLAYRRIVGGQGYAVGKGYKIHDLVAALGIEPLGGDPQSAFIIARHIQRFCALFCNSDKAKVADIDYRSTVSDGHALSLVKRHYAAIETGARRFLAKMDRKELDATHDFYLKKYQLARPVLHYDCILFDEGQDASPVMLDVFLSQKAQQVIVGDIHQQIYGWRHAINALKRVDFPSYSLTASFRFNAPVAHLAMECLSWKQLLGKTDPATIQGLGENVKVKTTATIARTNLALLKSAIDTVQGSRSVKKIYFEGNINSYTYAADGASIYDVLNLSTGHRARIRDPLIASMPDFDALREYAEASEDMELGMLITIVEDYGAEIPAILKKLTSMHLPDEKRESADMIFTTLHRSKGMEYDAVVLTDDFINKARISRMVEKERETPIDRDRIAEEINLAYVAVTRTRRYLDFPEEMFPETPPHLFTRSPTKKIAGIVTTRFKSTWNFTGQASNHKKPYKPWTAAEDQLLLSLASKGTGIKELSKRFRRTMVAIATRLKKLRAG